jgi:predicted nucleic acid-binding protein
LILIDTNIILESALAQERRTDCTTLLESISSGKIEAVITHFTLHAICATLSTPAKVIEFLRSIEGSIGFRVYTTTIAEEISAAILAEEIGKDFDDTLQYLVAKKVGASSIVSFDKHFNKLDIERREPSYILEKL